jgi:hypothetical protein
MPGGIRPQWFDMGQSAGEPGNNLVKDAVESPAGKASSAVTLAKILAGLGIAGIFGAIVGAIAAGAEAAAIHEGLDEEPKLEPGDGSPPEWPDDLEDPRDQLLDPVEAQAIAPQGQEALIPILTGNEAGAAGVSYWLNDGDTAVVDRARQLFWADHLGIENGYQGRWGVRCSEDPFNRRAGGKFPEFRLQVLKRLVVEI